MKFRLLIALVIFESGAIMTHALPTGETTDRSAAIEGTAPTSIESALIDFVFTDKGSLQELPKPISLGFYPKGKMFAFSENLHTQGNMMVYQYIASTESKAELRSGSAEPNAPLDIDDLNFESSMSGTFVNRQTRASGTFILTPNVWNTPSTVQALMRERVTHTSARGDYSTRAQRREAGAARATVAARTGTPAPSAEVGNAPDLGHPTQPVAKPSSLPAMAPSIKRPRAKDPKAVIYGGEIPFERTFKNVGESVDVSVLALLYESRVAEPDYMALGQACFHDFQVAGNDEFRKHNFIEKNLDAIEAKLDKAYAPHIIMFGMTGEKVSYDFNRKAYPCLALNRRNYVRGFGGGYGYIISNPQDALFFPIPPEAARVGVVEGGNRTQFQYSFFAIVDGLGAPSSEYPKVVSLRIVGYSLMIGNKFLGLYKLSTKELMNHQDADKDFADSLN